MKHYSVKYTSKATRSLAKIDEPARKTIYRWIVNNLEGCENPRLHGKALKGNLSDKWRYRIGDYRIIAEIKDDEVVILVVDIAHRREVYK